MTVKDNQLIIIDTTDKGTLLSNMREEGVESGHFTNGTYAYQADVIVPKILAGFQYIADNDPNSTPLVIAVNSDISMNGIMDKKGYTPEQKTGMEDQMTRAEKVAMPLAIQNPNRPVVVIFYDEETPTALYDFLAENEFGMETLHKWDYGTDKDGPKIEGAHNFKRVLAYPSPDNSQPLCHDITISEDQSGYVEVVDLTKEKLSNGSPYISQEGKTTVALKAIQFAHTDRKPDQP